MVSCDMIRIILKMRPKMALIDPSPFWWRVTQETFLWNYFEIGLLVQEEISLKVFTFIALTATMFRGANRLLQFWQRVTQGTFFSNHFEIGLLV